ncbi:MULTISPECIES: DNA/RNA non-specific endonuclease [Thiomicrorhabdus]|uniref:DNA/RNA non-specific endonuclease n=1 Tax=Thiomicrorhabdus heinhorstiae TaxID=2748010 RepID=A0ABS0BV60_9GAMM|nr:MULTISPECIES: DNA/RNA non-specific endonuclease [Thiomicrorhabdus]MBF6057720.1 DNA/RNA non-specific endonuclease [Thiomicrorhabdus heinhorstiae]
MTPSQAKRLFRPITALLFKRPKLLLLIPVLGGLWYGYEVGIARPAQTFMGVPQVQSGLATMGWSHILRNNGFMLEYSESLKNPLWVTYKVTDKRYVPGQRPSGFSQDWRSWSMVTHQDYTGSGYDRGHMAPNYLIASRYGREAQKQTFLMTNISPQKGSLNQKSWQRLEEVIANDFSAKEGEFWVVTGPIFSKLPTYLKGGKVAIPQAFYKILIKPQSGNEPAKALAFIFPQNAKANASLLTFVTTIDDVEAQTGIDFFSELDDDIEIPLEATETPAAWQLQKVANRPSRY